MNFELVDFIMEIIRKKYKLFSKEGGGTFKCPPNSKVMGKSLYSPQQLKKP